MTDHVHVYDEDGDCIVCGDDLFTPERTCEFLEEGRRPS